jgi:hypothetical protein
MNAEDMHPQCTFQRFSAAITMAGRLISYDDAHDVLAPQALRQVVEEYLECRNYDRNPF